MTLRYVKYLNFLPAASGTRAARARRARGEEIWLPRQRRTDDGGAKLENAAAQRNEAHDDFFRCPSDKHAATLCAATAHFKLEHFGSLQI